MVKLILTTIFFRQCYQGLDKLRRSEKITLSSVEPLDNEAFPSITFHVIDQSTEKQKNATIESLFKNILQPEESIYHFIPYTFNQTGPSIWEKTFPPFTNSRHCNRSFTLNPFRIIKTGFENSVRISLCLSHFTNLPILQTKFLRK